MQCIKDIYEFFMDPGMINYLRDKRERQRKAEEKRKYKNTHVPKKEISPDITMDEQRKLKQQLEFLGLMIVDKEMNRESETFESRVKEVKEHLRKFD
jgi:hypothetical protein